MRRYFLALVTFALAVNVVGQTASPSAPNTSSVPTKETKPLGTVSGRVVTAADGSPLRGAHAALIPVNSRSDQHMYAAVSDDDGRFLVKDVPAGKYTFFAVRAGYVQQHYKSHGTDEGAVLTLSPGQKIDEVLFRLTRAAVITGRVMDEDSEPLVGVRVVALQKPSEDELEDEGASSARRQELRPVGGDQTDDRGLYRIFGLQPGEYYIRASDKDEPTQGVSSTDSEFWVQRYLGSEYAPTYFPGVPQVDQAEVISLKPGEETQADLTLRRIQTAEVAGHVISPNGPAKRAMVQLAPKDQQDFASQYEDTTDDAGSFKMKGVPPGSYILWVYQSPNQDYQYEMSAQQKLEVSGENIESLTVAVGIGATIEGRVRSSTPGSFTTGRLHLSLAAIDEDNLGSWHGIVNKDGTFELKSVRDGNYAVHLWGLEQGWYMKSVRFGGEDVLEKGLQLENASAGGHLEIVVSSASAQLEGSVVEDDQPLVGATVRVTPDPETPYNKFRRSGTRTDQAGHFSFPSPAPGKYQVIARSPAPAENGHPKSEPQSITLSEHDKKTLDLKIVKPEPQ